MKIYKTRYQADRARATDPRHNSAEIIVKVCGGYVLMSPSDYNVWRRQK